MDFESCRPHGIVYLSSPRWTKPTVAFLVTAFVFALSGCQQSQPSATPGITGQVASESKAVQTPGNQAARPSPGGPQQLEPATLEAIALFNRGTALLEQYRYGEAAEILRQVVDKFPTWTAAKFNLALAYLNLQESKGAEDYLAQARDLFLEILEKNPNHLHARFCLGLLYEHLGDHEKALECFRLVYEADPQEPSVTYKYAEALLAVGKDGEGTQLLEKLVERDPGFVSGIYRLAMQYQRSRQLDKAKPLFARFKQLNAAELAGGSFTVRKVYGSAGKYYFALGPDSLPVERRLSGPQAVPVFEPELTEVSEATGRYEVGGVPVSLPPLAVGDWNKDGLLDLCTGGVNAKVVLCVNEGKRLFRLEPVCDTPATQLCPGDVDNDGHLDLWVAGKGLGVLLRNNGKGTFEQVALPALSSAELVVVLARLVDIDADGDLDLVAYVAPKGSIPPEPAVDSAEPVVAINRRDGTYEIASHALGLPSMKQGVGGFLWEDFDGDRDLDAIAFCAQEAHPAVVINDRVGASRLVDGKGCGFAPVACRSATMADIDKNQLPDVIAFHNQGIGVFVNGEYWQFALADQAVYPFSGLRSSGGQCVDVDNDGDLDLFLPDAEIGQGTRPKIFINLWPEKRFLDLDELAPGNILCALRWPGPTTGIAADFDNDGAIDLAFAPPGKPISIVWGQPTGRNWIQVELVGTQGEDQKTRSSGSPIGARLEVKAGAIWQQYSYAAPAGPAASCPLRVHAGLEKNQQVDWLRVIWPDGVLQAELEVPGNQLLTLTELQRKISSCPHLFAWTGHHFAFVSDFGGKGGLGYWIAPGVYAQPQPVELVPIPQLGPRDGQYVVKILEPLEEVVYVDDLKLWMIEHPVGTRVYPHEIMAVGIAPPPAEVLCFRQEIPVSRARDSLGKDITEDLKQLDRKDVGPPTIDPRFAGYAKDHFVDLEFDVESQAVGPRDRIFLIGQGWVNYAYSSTNFAAAQAGLRLRAPSVYVWREDNWVCLVKEAGYPAGINHAMLLELTGLLKPGDRKFRIETNMEIHWDRFALGIAEAELQRQVAIRQLRPSSAHLSFYGFPREYSPEGRKPNLYDYSNVDKTATWKRPAGFYTQFGEVTPLVAEQDNCFVIMGPGEELTVTFEVPVENSSSPGHARSFVLKTVSFCKDMDWHTAYGQTVAPLPFHQMSRYPYGPEESYPFTPQIKLLHERYNTRRVGDLR
ncbi:MAG: FG-GAP-like repeat-containing protein [Thermoguttaceae bacterium]|nr:FG-GAP-like repeat-containing protein [Thermoguttaceae bacterium]MDW8077742.1 FG-GAP-like repeat-containing protein [Thermoguttaceae bacterium]